MVPEVSQIVLFAQVMLVNRQVILEPFPGKKRPCIPLENRNK